MSITKDTNGVVFLRHKDDDENYSMLYPDWSWYHPQTQGTGHLPPGVYEYFAANAKVVYDNVDTNKPDKGWSK